MKQYVNLKSLLRREGCDSAWAFGRALYRDTDCGPWVRFLRKGNSPIYYEDAEAHHPIALCIGIEIGSIVEGSDVEIGPVTLMFPFSSKKLRKTIQWVNDEAVAAWLEANAEQKGE